jgi:hypothetical protein
MSKSVDHKSRPFRSRLTQLLSSILKHPVLPPAANSNHPDPAPNYPLRVAAIISVCDQTDTFPAALTELKTLPFQTEIICVIHGSQAKNIQTARSFNAGILEISESLPRDTGYALGAQAAEHADVYLFTTADLIIKTEELVLFTQAINAGIDVALNDFSGILGTEALFNPLHIYPYFLNLVLQQGRLGSSSLMFVPYALSQKAVRSIGCTALARPPLAMVRANFDGLAIQGVHFVDATAANNRHSQEIRSNCSADPMMDDYLKAIAFLHSELGIRGWFPDNLRQRYHMVENEIVFDE